MLLMVVVVIFMMMRNNYMEIWRPKRKNNRHGCEYPDVVLNPFQDDTKKATYSTLIKMSHPRKQQPIQLQPMDHS